MSIKDNIKEELEKMVNERIVRIQATIENLSNAKRCKKKVKGGIVIGNTDFTINI